MTSIITQSNLITRNTKQQHIYVEYAIIYLSGFQNIATVSLSTQWEGLQAWFQEDVDEDHHQVAIEHNRRHLDLSDLMPVESCLCMVSLTLALASKLRGLVFKSQPGTLVVPVTIIMSAAQLKTSFELNPLTEGKHGIFQSFLSFLCMIRNVITGLKDQLVLSLSI